MTVTNGEVTVTSGLGRGRFTMATGTASALSGKTYSFTFKSAGPGQFVMDVKDD